MGTKSIKQLNECTSPALGDAIEIETVAGAPRWLSFTRLFTLLFGGKTIGGSNDGDILINNGGQTATGMRLEDPKINSGTALAATSEEIDDAVDIAKAYLQNVDADVQTQLDEKADLSVIGNYPRLLRLNFTTGGAETTKVYTEANLLTALGITNYYIDYAMDWRILELSGSNWSEDADGAVVLSQQSNPITGQVHLDSVSLSSLTASTNYALVLMVRVVTIVTAGS